MMMQNMVLTVGNNRVAVGITWRSNASMDHSLQLRCAAPVGGWTAGTGQQLSISAGFDTGIDDTWHGASCPTGTFISQIDIYASNYFDGEMVLFCRFIKPT